MSTNIPVTENSGDLLDSGPAGRIPRAHLQYQISGDNPTSPPTEPSPEVHLGADPQAAAKGAI